MRVVLGSPCAYRRRRSVHRHHRKITVGTDPGYPGNSLKHNRILFSGAYSSRGLADEAATNNRLNTHHTFVLHSNSMRRGQTRQEGYTLRNIMVSPMHLLAVVLGIYLTVASQRFG